jgi:hypothetical protein
VLSYMHYQRSLIAANHKASECPGWGQTGPFPTRARIRRKGSASPTPPTKCNLPAFLTDNTCIACTKCAWAPCFMSLSIRDSWLHGSRGGQQDAVSPTSITVTCMHSKEFSPSLIHCVQHLLADTLNGLSLFGSFCCVGYRAVN